MVVTLIFIIAVAAWCLYQNEVTHKERLRIINYWASLPDWRPAADAFNSVPYTQHLLSRIFLRPPRKLYDPILQGAWQ